MSISRTLSLVALGAVLASPLAGSAQTAPAVPTAPAPGNTGVPTGRHAGHHRESLLHALRAVNLTVAQRAQVKGFRDARNMANVNADPATRRANAIKFRAQIMGILTPDQKAQLRTEMRRPAEAPGANAAPSAPGSR